MLLAPGSAWFSRFRRQVLYYTEVSQNTRDVCTHLLQSIPTMRQTLTAAVLLLMLTLSFSSVAALGVTDDCQEDIRNLKEDMARDKDDYTAESRTKANAELTMAKTNRLNPVKCRKNIQDARSELRKGRRDKSDKKIEKERPRCLNSS